MAAYVIRRLAALVPVLLVVGVVVFTLIHLTPGDPAVVMAGSEASAEQIAALRVTLGLDAPLWLQFVRWFGAALTGNLGTSIYFHETVAATLLAHAGPTVSLTLVALAFALVLAIPSGIAAAVRRGTPVDRIFLAGSLLGSSVPTFWLGLVAILLFGVSLRLFPVAGYVTPDRGIWLWLHTLILPATVLALQQAGIIARMLRESMVEAFDAAYVQTARAKGLAMERVVARHVLPNALIPTVTVIGSSLATLLGGAVVTETVFTIPGIGQLIVDSIERRDYPVVQGAVLVVAVVYVLVNLLVDVSYAFIDPRIRYE